MQHTPESFAAMLHGRQYRDEITREEERQAHLSDLVVVYGASDDLCEVAGAWGRDEAGCNDGGTIYFKREGLFTEPDRDEREVLKKYGVLKAAMDGICSFEAVWCGRTADGRECSWCYKADFPHATFDIMEDGELYCQGFVFRLEDALRGKK